MSVFDFDHTLPALPIPEIADTCENLKAVTRPLLDEKEWQLMCAAVDSFAQNEGPVLQTKLQQWKAGCRANSSWLRPFWDDNYLSFRDRLPINMNYTFQLTKERWGKDALPRLLHGLCQITAKMDSGDLPPEMIRETPLSMETLTHMIYTRIPDDHRDVLYYPPLSAPGSAAVVCRGHWFLLALTDQQGAVLAPTAIARGLEQIRADAAAAPAAAGVGTLTCAPRAEAASLRRLLQENLTNRLNLEAIENALCVVCLDEYSDNSFVRQLIIGDPLNRWFDKSLQFISDSRNLGVSIEHAGCDAGIWIYLLNQIDRYILDKDFDKEAADQTPYIRPLEWQLNTPGVARLEQAAADYSSCAENISVAEKKLSSLSRNRVKSVKCSPDAVVQALYQAAYYKVTGRFRSTYEAVSTRMFHQGRTECVRPCTEASADFAKALVEKSAPTAALLEKFRLSEQAHKEQIKRCQSGLGPERHISGLIAMQLLDGADQPLPPLFETVGYQTLKHDAHCTSSTAAPYIDFFGFGPVVADGIGIGYGLQAEALHISVSAYQDSRIAPEEYINALDELAEQFFSLF